MSSATEGIQETRRANLNDTFFFLIYVFEVRQEITCLFHSVEKVMLVQGHFHFPSSDGMQL